MRIILRIVSSCSAALREELVAYYQQIRFGIQSLEAYRNDLTFCIYIDIKDSGVGNGSLLL